ncbi:flagellar hook-basal body complex protein FliE [Porphyrobacter algicida]|uniref:Flagellar hook-basal body complex protein FliE n=2 Tax=Qipengyuania algicida TaxID=1836209 RepID=A0A845AD97_9SPHN|nr:flagellar hook-basal body complex protein FliE [Qipengyuania algicida]MXP27654.1 flagellar hook-basal body complex protein FliE [Qipengyuania algicida]
MAMREQIRDRSQHIRALQEQPAPAATGTTETGGPSDFAGVLRQSLESVNASQNEASRLSEAYERGEVTDVAKVMLARQEAGVAFETTLQVRNKLLNAYQEIMRMGV